MARPTLCTPDTIAAICAAVEKGHPDSWICDALGIAPETVMGWKRKGAAGDEPYATFLRDYSRAREARRSRLLSVVEDAAIVGGEYKAAMWLLERQERQEFGRQAPEVNVTVEAPKAAPDVAPIEAKKRLRAIGGGE